LFCFQEDYFETYFVMKCGATKQSKSTNSTLFENTSDDPVTQYTVSTMVFF